MQLADIVDQSISANSVRGRINVHSAMKSARPKVLRSKSAILECVDGELSRRIKDRATRGKRAVSDVRQGTFFGDKLRVSYAVDTEGRHIVETGRLTRLEWKRIIKIREKQLDDDSAQLKALHDADRQLSPIWDRMPDAAYGEVEAEYLRRQRRTA